MGEIVIYRTSLGSRSPEAANCATLAGNRGATIWGIPVETISAEIGLGWRAAIAKQSELLGLGQLVLRYTPLMYSAENWRIERELTKCWRALAQAWPPRRSFTIPIFETGTVL